MIPHILHVSNSRCLLFRNVLIESRISVADDAGGITEVGGGAETPGGSCVIQSG